MSTFEHELESRSVPEAPTRAAAAAPSAWPRWLLLVGLAAVVGWGLYAFAVPWQRFRAQHVITRDATVLAPRTDVGARTSGVVVALDAAVGAAVRRGDVLARLEDASLRVRVEELRLEERLAAERRAVEALAIAREKERLALHVEQSRAALRVAEAEHDAAEAEQRAARAEQRVAEAELEHAKSSLSRWEAEHARLLGLQQSGSVSANEVDRVTAARDAARAEVASATSGIESAAGRVDAAAGGALSAAGRVTAAEVEIRCAEQELAAIDVREAGLAVLDARIELARAATRVAEADLDAAFVRAPCDGRVVAWLAGLGGSVRVGQPILSLELSDGLFVQAWIDQESMGDFTVGAAAEVTFDAYPEAPVAAIVEAVAPQVAFDEQGEPLHATKSQLLPRISRANVRIALREPVQWITPAMTAQVAIRRAR